MRAALDAIHGARSMRGAYKVPPSKVVPIYVTTKDAARFAHLSAHSDDIATLARADLTILDPDGEAPSQCATQVVDAQCSVHAELKVRNGGGASHAVCVLVGGCGCLSLCLCLCLCVYSAPLTRVRRAWWTWTRRSRS